MHERQLRLRRRREIVGLADGVGHPLAQRDQQIGALHLADQRRRHAYAHIAAVIRMGRVEQLRPAVSWADRQYPLLGKAVEVGEDSVVMYCIGQQRTADQDQRPIGGFEHHTQPVKIVRPRPRHDARPRRVELGLGFLIENILGQYHCHRTRSAALRNMEGASDRFRRLFRLVDFEDQFRDIGQKPGIVLLLQRQAAEILSLDLAYQDHHRRCVVVGRMQ